MHKQSSQGRHPTEIPLPLSGVAPNVIRELSGIYPTFVSAFKELVSNAFDADATLVSINISTDFKRITIEDNGLGMTPFELQKEYIRIGGSAQHRRVTPTNNGRYPIGRKGIGFLAIGRYCDNVEIHSHANREVSFIKEISLQPISHNGDRISFLDEPLSIELAPFTIVKSIKCKEDKIKPDQFTQDGLDIVLADNEWERLQEQTLTVQYIIDFGQIDVYAVIDYDYLLGLQEYQNLETLTNFCRVRISDHLLQSPAHFTRITLRLKDFVQQELQVSRKRGRVRNISSESGLDRFIWRLSRSTPISYNLTQQELQQYNLEALSTPISPTPFIIKVTDPNNKTQELKRPILEVIDDFTAEGIVACQEVKLETDGLVAQGYLLGFSQPIFPAELRGIAIRVHGVEIGQPGFLGIETDLPVRLRPLLRQVMGEIIITEGFDAIAAITPGREGFYNDNTQFNTLRSHLVGDGISNFGEIGKILQDIWEQNSVKSSVIRILQEAKQRRNAFLSVSQALTGLSISSRYGLPLRKLFTRFDIEAHDLREAPEYHNQLPKSIGEYNLEKSDSIDQDYELDMNNKIVYLYSGSDIWIKSLYILGRDFLVSLREDGLNGTLCEIDFSTNTIFVNWMHPTRSKMGDAMFIKSALFWRVAYLATQNNADEMMDMAHRLLTFTP